ncbi:MAG: LamG-like jellyroll fold domain-containing protein, partial [Solirubrobacteraceae bacterium]
GCVDIAGATAQSYTLTADDVGSTIRVAVTASNEAGSASASSDATAVVAAAAPTNTASPTISGTPEAEQTLSADPGTWSGTEPIAYAYQWRRCDDAGAGCADIAGATAQSYTLTSADVGSTVRVRVTASNAAGSGSASSGQTAVIAAAPDASYRDLVLENSPHGYWRLNETSGTVAADEAVGGNDGSYQNGVGLGAPGALLETPNSAARFDGSNDVVNFGDPADGAFDMGSDDFTFEAWVSTTVHDEAPLMSKNTSSGPDWVVSVTDDGSHDGKIRAKINDGAVTIYAYGPDVLVDDGNWHHVVVLFDRDTGIWIYVDGVSRLKSGSTTGNISNSASLRAGAATGYGHFTGRLDEVALYPGLLSETTIEAHLARGDLVPPSVTLANPEDDATISDATPRFSGTAGTEATDEDSVTVAVYDGDTATGTPVQTLTAARSSSGSWSVESGSALADGTYTARATQEDAAGNAGVSSANTFTVSTAPAASSPVIAAAGDIACDPANSSFNGGNGTSSSCHQKHTSDLLVSTSFDAVLAAGDIQYECAGPSAFEQSYHPTWGRLKSITYPAPGNHEYQKTGGTGCDSSGKASGYFDYFGARAGNPSKGYYSFNLGSWHLIALNSMCYQAGGCAAGSPQEEWLRADLAANPAACTLAFFHYPRFSSGPSGSDTSMGAFFEALYEARAEIVLSGHDHLYERFAPQTPDAALDSARGVRQFVVGTGGRSLFSFSSTVEPNSEVRSKTYGILKLVLHPTEYEWQFVSEAGKTFTDSGSTDCH